MLAFIRAIITIFSQVSTNGQAGLGSGRTSCGYGSWCFFTGSAFSTTNHVILAWYWIEDEHVMHYIHTVANLVENKHAVCLYCEAHSHMHCHSTQCHWPYTLEWVGLTDITGCSSTKKVRIVAFLFYNESNTYIHSKLLHFTLCTVPPLWCSLLAMSTLWGKTFKAC